MDLENKPLRCFVAVAEEGSFTRAAQRLHTTQPGLSMQVRELEKHLGFDLFIRTTRRIELTKKGQTFMTAARRMIAESDRMKNTIMDLRSEEARRLGLGAAFYTIDIPERVSLIERFMAAHPEISLDIDNRWQGELVGDLVRGGMDLALIIGVPVSPEEYEAAGRGAGNEILYPADLERIVLRRESVGLLVPAESPLAARRSIPASALAGMRIAMLSPAHGAAIYDPVARLLEGAGAELVIPPEGNGIGVERYGRQFRIPAVTLGWFGERDSGSTGMVRRSIAGLDISTELMLLGMPRDMRPPARTFWNFAAMAARV